MFLDEEGNTLERGEKSEDGENKARRDREKNGRAGREKTKGEAGGAAGERVPTQGRGWVLSLGGFSGLSVFQRFG